jgi:integration host factor subunit alpha
MRTLTRLDIVQALAFKMGIPQKTCRLYLSTLLSLINKCVGEKNENLIIKNFGKFYLRQKKEHLARNPKTGETAIVTARTRIYFKPAPKLERRLQIADNLEAIPEIIRNFRIDHSF